jgi:hypothetical protein
VRICAEVHALRDEHPRTIAPASALGTEPFKLARPLSNLVNQAYGLTPDEIALLCHTTLPRTPSSSPAR